MGKIKNFILTLLTIVLIPGCSLLKVTIPTGEPLPQRDIQLRIMTREFYNKFQNEIASAADSIINTSDDIPLKVKATVWKMQTTRSAATAAMHSIPEIAALETFMLCNNLEYTFSTQPDSLLFNGNTPGVRKVITSLKEEYQNILKGILPEDRMNLMSEFAENNKQALTSDNKNNNNYVMLWTSFLKEKGIEYNYPAGSISEAVTEVGGKMEGYMQQMSNNVSWGIDIFGYKMKQDSVYNAINMQIDSLNHDFERMVLVMEHLPEISDYMMTEMNKHVQQILESFNYIVNSSFSNFDLQRVELQKYISQERTNIMNEVHKTTEDALQIVIDSLPAMVGKITIWIILILLILIGVPVSIGFFLGKAYGKKRNNNKT